MLSNSRPKLWIWYVLKRLRQGTGDGAKGRKGKGKGGKDKKGLAGWCPKNAITVVKPVNNMKYE